MAQAEDALRVAVGDMGTGHGPQPILSLPQPSRKGHFHMLIEMLSCTPHQEKDSLPQCYLLCFCDHHSSNLSKWGENPLGRRGGFLSQPRRPMAEGQPLALLTCGISLVPDPIWRGDRPRVTVVLILPFQPNTSVKQILSRALWPAAYVYMCAHTHAHVHTCTQL